MKRLTRSTLIAAWLAFMSSTVVSLCPSAAVADDTDSTVQNMIEQASDDYDTLEIAKAQKTLEDAVRLAERKGADSAVLADAYVMLGIVKFAQSRDEADAKQAFIEALKQDYNASIPPNYRNPTLEGVMDAARQQAPAPKQASSTPEPGDFEHHSPKTVQAGEPLQLEAFLPADMPVYRVFVYHRRFDEDNFRKLEMNATGTTRFAAEIPAEQVTTSQIEYYISVVNRSGDVIARAGQQSSPLVTTVLGSGGSEAVGQADRRPDVPMSNGAGLGQHVYIMAFGGSGLGFLPGGSPTAHPQREVSGGLAPAFGHAMIEAGYMMTRNAYLGVYTRWQFAPTQNFSGLPSDAVDGGSFATTDQECLGTGLPGDCLLGLKYRWFFANSNDFRMYSSTGAGIGRVRHWLRLKQPYYADDGQTPTAQCKGKSRVDSSQAGDICYVRDTVRPGWAHLGVGGGFMWPIHKNIALAADAYLIVLVPDTGVNLDVNLGVNFQF